MQEQTQRTPHGNDFNRPLAARISSGKDLIGFAEAMGRLSREERFRATV